MGKPKVVKENPFESIFEDTVSDMKRLGTYKQEFSPVITRYAEMRMQFSILMDSWYRDGCKITEKYTNKAGATNNRKTALYQSIESLRKELLDLENILGLTPAGVIKINKNTLEKKRESKLEAALKQYG